jgi:hypothetical protein
VRKPQGELQGASLKISPETHSHDLKLFFESLRDPSNHIGDQAPRQTLKRSRGPLIIGAMDDNFSSIHGNRNSLRERMSEKALGSGHLHFGGVEGDLHFLRHDNGHPSNTRHPIPQAVTEMSNDKVQISNQIQNSNVKNFYFEL